MNFLVPLGLGLALFVIGPLIAHSLRRGSVEQEVLPTLRFIDEKQSSSRNRRTLSDRSLLALRMLLVLLLALLAASPLLPLGSLSLARSQGRSLGVSLVIDDSASMRVRTKQGVKFDLAVRAALELLESAQDGDSISIVLAGKPARQHVAATRNIDSIRRALRELKPSERETDLDGALVLARASLNGLLQSDQQIALLSDLAFTEPFITTKGAIPVRTPLPSLREPYENCAVIAASRSASRASADIRCTSPLARRGRSLGVFRQDLRSDSPKATQDPLFRADVPEGDVLHFSLPNDLPADTRLIVALDSSSIDQVSSDDSLELQIGEPGLAIGIQADSTHARAETSEKTVLELGLEALNANVRTKILPSVPESTEDLNQLSALIIDDPSGFSPESQNTLEAWVQGGGALFVLLGPKASSAPLSTGFWPVTRGFFDFREAPRPLNVRATDTENEMGRGYDTLAARKRMTFDPIEGAKTLLSFDDETPLLVERQLGRGIILLSALPASLSVSDFSLRPGFLAILDHLLTQAQSRVTNGPALPGAEWNIPPGYHVIVPPGSAPERTGPERFIPSVSGRVQIRGKEGTIVRIVGRHGAEVVRQPRELEVGADALEAPEAPGLSPVSRQLALLILALGVVELLVRRRRFGATARNAIGAA